MPKGNVAHAAADSLRRGIRFPRGQGTRLRVADQLDPGNQPALADLADVRMPCKGSEKLAEAGDLLRETFERPLFLEDVERGHGRRGLLLVDREDGHVLGDGMGPVRIVVPGDKRPARWARMVTSLDVLSVGDASVR